MTTTVDPTMTVATVRKLTKQAPAEQSAAGTLEGYASVYGNVDRVGDRVMPGAFGQASFRLPLFYDHNEPIGGAICTPDQFGLHVQAEYANTPRAQEIRELAKVGAVPFMSFMYGVTKGDTNEFGGLDLYELDTMEVSVVPIPCNPKAAVMASKKLGEVPDVDTKVGRRNAAKDQEAIQQAHDNLVAAGATCGEKAAPAVTMTNPAGITATVVEKAPMGDPPPPTPAPSAADATVNNPVDLAQALDQLIDEAIEAFDAGEPDELDALLTGLAVASDALLAVYGATDPDDADEPAA